MALTLALSGKVAIGANGGRGVGVGVMVENGHCTYLADSRWILCDTYPSILGCQVPYLFDTTARRKRRLGTFFAPPWYRGPDRCDLQLRASPSGRLVALDSAHQGGWQMYLIDVSAVVGDGAAWSPSGESPPVPSLVDVGRSEAHAEKMLGIRMTMGTRGSVRFGSVRFGSVKDCTRLG